MFRIKRLSLLALPLALAVLSPLPVQAAPQQTTRAVAAPAAFCAVLAVPAKERAVDGPKVVCSDTSAAAAGAALPAATAARVRLMTYYADAGWAGRSMDVYGDYGYCDQEGYPTFDPSDYWEANISSIRGYQTCNAVRGFSAGRSGSKTYFEHNLSWSFGATTFNDDMGSVRVFCNRSC